ncbi:hypothetical protein O6H91_13G062900 [Diphasiastrum complanatum]|uniref:Uncharacterized protein n=1 Tax=Diphasiastrum complanatum TaxID=34168 RepID=A0ACC2BVM2_DIPCM|nr:hypothetical protein O6H91_13G062900 [Diphasiastrum complanatum]
MTTTSTTEVSIHIREVWADNLEEEFKLIRGVVHTHPYIAMDTAFPGVVIKPSGVFISSFDYNYQILKLNVDKLKLIQLGLAFTDEHGNLPTCNTGEGCVWQFNFREFHLREDLHAPDSIDLLKQSGINFQMNEDRGIDASIFTELFASSEIVYNPNVHWITFHGAHDFGYLLKMLTQRNLPYWQADFFNLMKLFFPTFYDVKYLMRFCDNLYGSLNKLAEKLNVERVGSCHQAGSDSLLTALTYTKLKQAFFHGSTDKYVCVLNGLDSFSSFVTGSVHCVYPTPLNRETDTSSKTIQRIYAQLIP